MIDFVVDSGGGERFAAGLAQHLPRDRFETWLCSTRGAEPEFVAALTKAGVRHINLGRRFKWDVHRFGRLAAVLRRERFDIVHAHKFGSNVWGTLIGCLCRVPVDDRPGADWSYTGNRLRKWLDGQV